MSFKHFDKHKKEYYDAVHEILNSDLYPMPMKNKVRYLLSFIEIAERIINSNHPYNCKILLLSAYTPTFDEAFYEETKNDYRRIFSIIDKNEDESISLESQIREAKEKEFQLLVDQEILRRMKEKELNDSNV